MVEMLGEGCRRQMVSSHYRERAEQRDGQFRAKLEGLLEGMREAITRRVA